MCLSTNPITVNGENISHLKFQEFYYNMVVKSKQLNIYKWYIFVFLSHIEKIQVQIIYARHSWPDSKTFGVHHGIKMNST